MIPTKRIIIINKKTKRTRVCTKRKASEIIGEPLYKFLEWSKESHYKVLDKWWIIFKFEEIKIDTGFKRDKSNIHFKKT